MSLYVSLHAALSNTNLCDPIPIFKSVVSHNGFLIYTLYGCLKNCVRECIGKGFENGKKNGKETILKTV